VLHPFGAFVMTPSKKRGTTRLQERLADNGSIDAVGRDFDLVATGVFEILPLAHGVEDGKRPWRQVMLVVVLSRSK